MSTEQNTNKGKEKERDPKSVSIEDDDEDLDDLDDVLASFNQPKPTPSAPSKSQGAPNATATAPPAEGEGDDFEASLAENMEALLRQLGGDTSIPPNSTGAPSDGDGLDTLSPDEQEEAWQKAIEMMLSGKGLDDLGPPPASASASGSGPSPGSGSGPKPTFEETLKRTMESLNSAGTNKAPGASAGEPDLAALLAQLGAADGGGDGGDDDDLGGLLDGMMSQLMTKEVLEEPMAELAAKYPEYLASPPPSTSAEDLEKYKQQYTLVQKIVDTFKKPGYSDEKDGKEIARLVTEMQDLGGPPAEIMGDLPEGFDLGTLGGGEEGCTIM